MRPPAPEDAGITKRFPGVMANDGVDFELRVGEPARISRGQGSYSTPVWSPRGDLIAFTKMTGGPVPDRGDEA